MFYLCVNIRTSIFGEIIKYLNFVSIFETSIFEYFFRNVEAICHLSNPTCWRNWIEGSDSS